MYMARGIQTTYSTFSERIKIYESRTPPRSVSLESFSAEDGGIWRDGPIYIYINICSETPSKVKVYPGYI